MRYRFLKGRLKRAMGNMTIAALARRSNVSRNIITRILDSTNQYVEVDRVYLERLALTLGVTYEFLAYGRVHEHLIEPYTQADYAMNRAFLLNRVQQLESRRAAPSPNRSLAWASEQKLEIRWTPEGKCQILQDREFVVSEADDIGTALVMAHTTQREQGGA
jgi:transcriptional regulator with XRE-family HTH domain